MRGFLEVDVWFLSQPLWTVLTHFTLNHSEWLCLHLNHLFMQTVEKSVEFPFRSQTEGHYRAIVSRFSSKIKSLSLLDYLHEFCCFVEDLRYCNYPRGQRSTVMMQEQEKLLSLHLRLQDLSDVCYWNVTRRRTVVQGLFASFIFLYLNICSGMVFPAWRVWKGLRKMTGGIPVCLFDIYVINRVPYYKLWCPCRNDGAFSLVASRVSDASLLRHLWEFYLFDDFIYW